VVGLVGATIRTRLEHLVPVLRRGVTVVAVRPAIDSPELRAVARDWQVHVEDHQALTADEELAKAIDAAGVLRIGYRPLRELQQAG
jgi:hypothetical protein